MNDATVMTWDTPAVIVDGFSRRAYIEARPGLHPELRFTYVPILAEDVEELSARMVAPEKYKLTPKQLHQEMLREIAKGIVAWSWGAGKPTYEELRRTSLGPVNRIYMIMSGSQPSDTDPELAGLESQEGISETLGKS